MVPVELLGFRLRQVNLLPGHDPHATGFNQPLHRTVRDRILQQMRFENGQRECGGSARHDSSRWIGTRTVLCNFYGDNVGLFTASCQLGVGRAFRKLRNIL